ncbi:cobalt-precorrin-6A reductase [Ahrensia sp. R2A130]|uniref:cobalt-precorrin-6A reductase n=1 Tax=Ahrensia sp. R2A130 TaxID=744979 RepID=UPI0001E0AC61|nr:cobalt-precorrin-6A reductase [Ahrensia sp. R2A130]EFL90678.1 precorrin-6x reductase CbiJ/CobK [Ahrensia sp. R2A130]
MSADRILLLGGTREAVALAAKLVAEGHDVTTSLAGRTKEPREVKGKLRVGGFGGANGLAQWIAENHITRLIDATHPFAETISRNASLAAKATGVVFERNQRQIWQPVEGDVWHSVADLKSAAANLRAGSTVLLALGSQYLEAFENRTNVRFIIRMIDPPVHDLAFADFKLVLSRPSAEAEIEEAFLKANNVDTIVCRNSGGAGAYAKIEAARLLNIPVVMVKRPKS